MPGLGVAEVARLVAVLHGVADPRKVRGIRFRVGTVLAVMVFSVLAGARNFREIGDRAADLPDQLLGLAGCPIHPLTGRYVVPSEPTMRRMAHAVDAADRKIGAWLHAQATAAAIGGSEGTQRRAEDLVAVAMDDRWYRSSKTCSGCGAVKTKPA